MRSTLLLFSLFTSSLALADAEPLSFAKTKFCEERLTDKNAIQKMLYNSQNSLSFYNQGGLFGGGTCWWHSRFTRAAAYLAVFDPSLPRPTDEEAKKIINHIRKRKGVIVVPGFRNLYEFSYAYGQEILNKLEDWQRSDALMKFNWLNGMFAEGDYAAEKFSRRMDDLYQRVQNGEVVYQMLQMPGIAAHSWLVVGMQPTSDGYVIEAIDSNMPQEITRVTYRRGMESLILPYAYYATYKIMPHTGNTKEERKLRAKMEKACAKAGIDVSDEDEEEDDRG